MRSYHCPISYAFVLLVCWVTNYQSGKANSYLNNILVYNRHIYFYIYTKGTNCGLNVLVRVLLQWRRTVITARMLSQHGCHLDHDKRRVPAQKWTTTSCTVSSKTNDKFPLKVQNETIKTFPFIVFLSHIWIKSRMLRVHKRLKSKHKYDVT